MFLLFSSVTSAKQILNVGDFARNSLKLPTGESLSLPSGEWVVRVSTDQYKPQQSSSRWLVVGLANKDPSAHVQGLVFSRALDRVNWGRTGCENRRNSMFMDTYGVQPSELRTFCSYAWRVGNIFEYSSSRQQSEGNRYWAIIEPLVRSLSPVSGGDMLAANIFIREYGGFGLEVRAYLRPPHVPNGSEGFLADALTMGRFSSENHDALASWIEQYTAILKDEFLDGRAGKSKGPMLVFTNGVAGSVSDRMVPMGPNNELYSTQGAGANDNRPSLMQGVSITSPQEFGVDSERKNSSELDSQSPPSVQTGPLFTKADEDFSEQKKLLVEQNREMQRLLSELKQARDAAAKAAADAQGVALAIRREAEQKKSQSDSFAATTSAPRRALVIGNDAYSGIAPLRNAVADAEAMAAALTDFGYSVTKHLNVDERSFKRAIRDFKASLFGGEEVLFFFAGHGVQVAGTNFLLPVDTKGESEAQVRDESIQLQRILDDLEEAKTKFTLAVVDACRDNPFKTAGRSIGGRGLAPTAAATGQMVIFSAGAGQQALDQLGPKDVQRNGVFTRVFLTEMARPAVPVDRLLRNVRAEVVRLAKSIGHEQTPALYDQTIGEFYLNLRQTKP